MDPCTQGFSMRANLEVKQDEMDSRLFKGSLIGRRWIDIDK